MWQKEKKYIFLCGTFSQINIINDPLIVTSLIFPGQIYFNAAKDEQISILTSDECIMMEGHLSQTLRSQVMLPEGSDIDAYFQTGKMNKVSQGTV